ncbi:MAG: glutaminase [Frankia sp.]
MDLADVADAGEVPGALVELAGEDAGGAGREAGRGPMGRAVERVYRQFRYVVGGENADYIGALEGANTNKFSVAVVMPDGTVHASGNVDAKVTIQSVSKVFAKLLAMIDHGVEGVRKYVGNEPTGERFNSHKLEEVPDTEDEDGNKVPGRLTGRALNGAVNAGAVMVNSMIRGRDVAERVERLRAFMSLLAGRELGISEEVASSELADSGNNQAIAGELRAAVRGAGLGGDSSLSLLGKDLGVGETAEDLIRDVVDAYCQQCAIEVTASDVARMMAVLANGGKDPVTAVQLVPVDAVEDAKSMMAMAGLYDAAGTWMAQSGVAAKSGVGGLIAGADEVGFAVLATELDSFGNAVKGQLAVRALSEQLGLHLFDSSARPVVETVRQEVRWDGGLARSQRVWPPAAEAALAEAGPGIIGYEVQGAVDLPAAEGLTRAVEARVFEGPDPVRAVVVDLRLVPPIGDPGAQALLNDSLAHLSAAGVTVFVAHPGDLPGLADALPTHGNVVRVADAGTGWEQAENLVVREALGLGPLDPLPVTTVPFEGQELFAGLDPAGLDALAGAAGETRTYQPGEVIYRPGAAADGIHFVVEGQIRENGGVFGLRHVPAGHAFGEAGALDAGGTRRTEVVAVEPTTVRVLSPEAFAALETTNPDVHHQLVTAIAHSQADQIEKMTDVISLLAEPAYTTSTPPPEITPPPDSTPTPPNPTDPAGPARPTDVVNPADLAGPVDEAGPDAESPAVDPVDPAGPVDSGDVGDVGGHDTEVSAADPADPAGRDADDAAGAAVRDAGPVDLRDPDPGSGDSAGPDAESPAVDPANPAGPANPVDVAGLPNTGTDTAGGITDTPDAATLDTPAHPEAATVETAAPVGGAVEGGARETAATPATPATAEAGGTAASERGAVEGRAAGGAGGIVVDAVAGGDGSGDVWAGLKTRLAALALRADAEAGDSAGVGDSSAGPEGAGDAPGPIGAEPGLQAASQSDAPDGGFAPAAPAAPASNTSPRPLDGTQTTADTPDAEADTVGDPAPPAEAGPGLTPTGGDRPTAGAMDAGSTAARPLYRADRRGPDEIFRHGFEAKGDNLDLVRHTVQNGWDSAFIPTSHNLESVRDFGRNRGMPYVYKLFASGVDANAEMDSTFFRHAEENEIAVPGSVPSSAVEGVWGPDGWHDNPASTVAAQGADAGSSLADPAEGPGDPNGRLSLDVAAWDSHFEGRGVGAGGAVASDPVGTVARLLANPGGAASPATWLVLDGNKLRFVRSGESPDVVLGRYSAADLSLPTAQAVEGQRPADGESLVVGRGDRILVGTAGLGALTEAEIHEVLATAVTPQEAVDRLVLALRGRRVALLVANVVGAAANAEPAAESRESPGAVVEPPASAVPARDDAPG